MAKVSIEIAGTTAEWLTETAKQAGWSLEEVVAEVLRTAVELDSMGLLVTEDTARKRLADVKVSEWPELTHQDHVLDEDACVARVVRVYTESNRVLVDMVHEWAENDEGEMTGYDTEDVITHLTDSVIRLTDVEVALWKEYEDAEPVALLVRARLAS